MDSIKVSRGVSTELSPAPRRGGEMKTLVDAAFVERMQPSTMLVTMLAVLALALPCEPASAQSNFVPLPAKKEKACVGSPSEHSTKLVLEGGEVADNLYDHLIDLARSRTLATQPYQPVAGDSICTAIHKQTNLPSKVRCPEPKAVQLFEILNPSRSKVSTLPTNQRVRVPAAFRVCESPYWRRYDISQKKDSERFEVDVKRWNASKPLWRNETEVRINFDGYEVEIPLRQADQATQAKILQDSRTYEKSTNIFIDPQKRGLERLQFSMNAEEQLAACASGQPVSYMDMLVIGSGWAPDRLPQDFQACASSAAVCKDGNCAKIVLVDTPVLPHPKLRRVLSADAAATRDPAAAGGKCEPIKFQEEFHGTHLAGIMLSEHGPRGFGGLIAGAQFTPLVRAQLNDAELAERIQELEDVTEGITPNVFVYASRFDPYRPDHLNSDGRLRDRALRFSTHLASKRIEETKALWIVAAGQEEDSSRPGFEISPESKFAPMNLGDQPNVVVVTACDKCTPFGATLMSQALYSGSIVSLAAPGRAILGLANETSFSFADGTSQATAFVAGIAAAMKSCYPKAYATQTAERVKSRLMLTARPAFQQSDYEKVQSGTLDPVLALVDPTKAWVKRRGAPLEKVTVAGWCSNPGAVQLGDFFGDVTTRAIKFEAASIKRITRTLDPGDFNLVVFTLQEQRIARSKPGRLKTADFNVAKLSDGTFVKISELEELILGFGPPPPLINCAVN
jgi:Subtilase family